MQNIYCRVIFIVFFITGFTYTNYANNAAYEQRRNDYIDTALAHFNDNALPLQAYRGIPLDTTELNNLAYYIETNGDADFNIVKAIRILFLSNGTYDGVLLPAVNSVKYWINSGDTTHVYWSENHMIMWMSSDWLMHEKYGRAIDTSLHNRLRHYLQLKVQYGYYEFCSSVYLPYCLTGLLNLADFAQDAEIKSLATQAAQKLLSDYLLRLTNDKGVFFPTAGRNYYGKYESAYGQNHSNLIYLLTGMGDTPGDASHAGAFLASSTLPIDTVSASWGPYLDTVYYNGHSIDSAMTFSSNQNQLNQTIFLWSGGGYFHPLLAMRTGQLLTDSNLWHHIDFRAFIGLQTFPLSSYTQLATQFASVSEGSVITGETISIFKHRSVTLSSVQDFWKGKVGYQEFPCVANAGTTAVFTASGEVFEDWNARSATNANDHLPYVKQKKNIALIMYRPEFVAPIFPFQNKDVALHWKNGDFDEVQTDSLWLIGRQGNGYVAARRYTLDTINNVAACHYTTDGQAYVIIVGDSEMYSSFNHFQSLIHQSQFSEERYYDSINNLSVYYAKIVFDTTTVEYAWGNDSVRTTNAVDNISATEFNVYPNPTNGLITADVSRFNGMSLSVKVLNTMGQVVYAVPVQSITGNTLTINLGKQPQGVYMVTLETAENRYVQKVVKNN